MRDFSTGPEWLSLNTMTVDRQGDLPTITEAAARHGIPALAIWRHQVAALGLERAARLIRDAGFVLSGYCRGGMLVADGAQRAAAREDNSRALEEAAVLGAPCLVIVPGGLPQFSRPGSEASKDIAAARAMVIEELGELLRRAREMGMPLALEPLHPMLAADRGCISTLRQALDICDALTRSRGALGVVDVITAGGSSSRARSTAPARDGCSLSGLRLAGAHEPSAERPRHDGRWHHRHPRHPSLDEAGFAGYAEVELFSERWWARPIDEVLGLCLERHRCRV